MVEWLRALVLQSGREGGGGNQVLPLDLLSVIPGSAPGDALYIANMSAFYQLGF